MPPQARKTESCLFSSRGQFSKWECCRVEAYHIQMIRQQGKCSVWRLPRRAAISVCIRIVLRRVSIQSVNQWAGGPPCSWAPWETSGECVEGRSRATEGTEPGMMRPASSPRMIGTLPRQCAAHSFRSAMQPTNAECRGHAFRPARTASVSSV